MVKFTLAASVLFASSVLGLGFTGKLVNIPDDIIAAQINQVSNLQVVNGLNFQSRIDVTLAPLEKSEQVTVAKIPVKKSYQFDVTDLHNGQYQLLVNSYDFRLRNDRFRVIVDDERISVYEEALGSRSYNESSVQVVGPRNPLVVDVVDVKEYYEAPHSKLSDMVMNSPLGFIFRSTLYTGLFVASITVMIAPYVLQWISPDLAEEMNQLTRGETGQSEPIANIADTPEPQAIKASGRAKGSGARLRK